ncbi:MAG TPA: 2-octaprenyl-6-methoxyphenyl hydroxylase [Steroidobacteraceae bacterium]|nr:2-octaprenyl-6-methoxyphenyl hydroxylase [Steroidobacteraceae bacterium]
MTDVMPESRADVIVAGGGLVGASLALALAGCGFDVELVESLPFGSSEQPSFDERTTAISNGTRRVFEALGVWPLMARAATPIRRIHVSDRGRFGFARIDAAEQGVHALGYVLPNRVMGAALWRRLEQTRVRVLAPARITGSTVEPDYRSLAVQLADRDDELRARLVIAADGTRSVVRETAGVGASTWEYDQTAVVTNVATQRFHDYVAYERFTDTGPIAVLPLSDGRCGIVWTLTPQRASDVMALPDEQFTAELQEAFGQRLGRFVKVGVRHAYPLALTRADEHIASRLAVVGNAAQGLHPIAGQGFNLGLRDAASLAEVLVDAHRELGAAFDPGSPQVLERYRSWRLEDRKRIVAFTDGLVRAFSNPFGPVKLFRNLGMLLFDLSPGAKRALSRLSLGAAGRVPRLARGAPL